MKKNAVVRVVDANRQYWLGKVSISALKKVSLSVDLHDFMVVAGPSGSGKTTLLNLMGLIDKPTTGEVWFEGENTSTRSLDRLHAFRRDKIGYVFQNFNLIPVLSVYENVEYPLILNKVPLKKRKKRVNDVLGQVGLYDRRKHRPRELSGGERQRVSLARAVIKNPALVLADEPTANLDSKSGMEVLKMMKKLHEDDGTTFVFSTHDPHIMEIAERVVLLRDGEIEGESEVRKEGRWSF